jgi:hypothetical protein
MARGSPGSTDSLCANTRPNIALAARCLVHTERMANEKEQKPKEQKPKEQKPKEQKSKEQKPKEQAHKKEEKGLLEATAEAIGSTLGTIALKTGIAHPEGRAKQKKIPKLVKKNKQKLPRKLKKRARKERGAEGSAPA